MEVFFDIETVGADDPAVIAEIAAGIQPPGNMKKPETIAAWERDEKPALIEQKVRETSFSGLHGRIVCIGFAIDDQPALSCESATDERGVIERAFWYLTQFCTTIHRGYEVAEQTRFIGHYIADFDLRFLFQRCVLLGIKPPSFIPFHARPWDKSLADTMLMWAGHGNRIGLDRLCSALGLPRKGSEIGDEIDGSKVWDYVRAGRIAEVGAYCRGDVERARAAYRRMTFAEAA